MTSTAINIGSFRTLGKIYEGGYSGIEYLVLYRLIEIFSVTTMNDYSIPDELRTVQTVAVALIDPSGKLLLANAGFLRLIGAVEDGNIPCHVADLFIQPTWGDLAALAAKADATLYQGLFTLGAHCGKLHSLKGRLTRQGQALYFFAEHNINEMEILQKSVLDLNTALTESQCWVGRANRELEQRVIERTQDLDQSRRFLSSLIDIIPGMVGYWTDELRCIFANKAYLDWFGKTKEEMLGITMQALMGERLFALNAPFIHAALRGERQSFERTLVKANGEIGYTWAQYLPDKDEQERVKGFFVLVTDITTIKQAELDLKKTNDELITARDKAEAADRAKSEFLANMSHEIRTPMNAIIGLSGLALDLDLTPRLHDYLHKISQSAQALLTILNDILDYSKVEAGRLELDATAFRLAEVLENVIQLFSVRADEQGLALMVETSPDVPQWLMGDPLRLGQVLTNLIGNAIKFTASGAVRVQVEHIADEPGFATLRFTVQDTGIGISETEVQHLFQPFTQADGSITRRFGGTGLGLAISQRLVRLMGSDIEVASTPGQGSVFSFTIRLVLSKQEPTSRCPLAVLPRTREAATALGGARILLVEDNAINQQVAQEILERWGLSVVVVGDGEQALAALAASDPFDVVLMDIQMPVMDGLEATRRIRRDERFRDLPVLAMTAAVMAKDQAECLEAGMNDHVAKPILPEQLLGVLERWIVPREHAMPARQDQPKAWLSGGGDWPDALPGFDLSQAIQRMNGNHGLLVTLLKQFGEQFATACETLAGVMSKGQREEAIHWVHQLKGVAGHLGATEVHRHAEALERELQAGQAPDSQAALDQALGVALAAIATLAPLPASTNAPGDEPRATALLQTVRTLLDQGEFIPLELVAELQNTLPDPALQNDLTRLKDQVAALDYSAAGHTLDRLTQTAQPSLADPPLLLPRRDDLHCEWP